MVAHCDPLSAYQDVVAQHQIFHDLEVVVKICSQYFDPFAEDPYLSHCYQQTKLNTACEEQIADGGGEEDGDSILVGMLPRVVEGHHSDLPRFRALIVVTACMEHSSSVVYYHYS